MKIDASTIDGYLAALPPERRGTVERLLDTFRRHLPPGFEERLQYGMPSFCVPHALYPAGYHVDPTQPLPFLSVAAQTNKVAVYHLGLYADPALAAWFRAAHAAASPRKLDMGKSCIRYRHEADIPFALLAELAGRLTPADVIAGYEAGRRGG